MKKLLGLCSVVLILVVAACGGGGKSGDGGGGCGNKCGGGGDTAMMDSMMKPYIDGTSKASYYVAIHKDPKAGQYWFTKTTSEMSGYKSEMQQKWQVAAITPDGAIVESQMISAGMNMPIMAYCVDASKSKEDAGKTGNVKKAWIGKPGEQGKEIQIMEVPKATEGGTPPPKDYEDKTEDFSALEVAGGKWNGKKMWMKKNDGSYEATTWWADNGWFDGTVKMEAKMTSGTMAMSLDKFGEDGKPWLKW